MTGVVQIVTTTSSREEAERIASELVERRLAACVQVSGPITSIYRWEGKLETGQEWRCTIKTRESHYPAVEAVIRKLHSYQVPEILVLPVAGGNRDYLAWLDEQLGPDVV